MVLKQILVRAGQLLESQPLRLGACLLLLATLWGSWLQFPLSESVSLIQLGRVSAFANLTLVAIMVVLTGFAVSLALNRDRWCRLFAALLFLLVWSAAVQSSFDDGVALNRYVSESGYTRDIQHLLSMGGTPNSGQSLQSALVFDDFRLLARLRASFAMLGWGAKLALLVSLGLMLEALLRHGSGVQRLRRLSATLLVWALLAELPTTAAAYIALNQAVREGEVAQFDRALSLLNTAATWDSTLAKSEGFALLASYLAYRHYGPDHPAAMAYRMNEAFSAASFEEVFALARFALLRNHPTDQQIDPGNRDQLLYRSTERLRQSLLTGAHLRAGMKQFRRQQWAAAEEQFRDALALSPGLMVSRLALTVILHNTWRYPQCISLAEQTLTDLAAPSFAADIWTVKGDCLAALGRMSESRSAYLASLSLDSDKNYRAVKGLSGT